jgi:flavodoxin
MLIHVLYDTVHGNTEAVAHAIGDALDADHEVLVARIGARLGLFDEVGLLVVGGPTHAHGMSKEMRSFLASADGHLRGLPVATFDTRIDRARLLTGAASGPIGKQLKRRGGVVVGAESFLVRGGQGPLLDGELDRAREWARGLVGRATGRERRVAVDLGA